MIVERPAASIHPISGIILQVAGSKPLTVAKFEAEKTSQQVLDCLNMFATGKAPAQLDFMISAPDETSNPRARIMHQGRLVHCNRFLPVAHGAPVGERGGDVGRLRAKRPSLTCGGRSSAHMVSSPGNLLMVAVPAWRP